MDKATISFPVDEGVLFSDHRGKRTKFTEKRQRKLARKIEFLKPFLRDEERVLLITTGSSPMSFFEKYLSGLMTYYAKRSLFVFTNQRIFHVPTNLNYSYRNSIAQIELADCSSIQMEGHRLVIVYNSDKVEKFPYIASRERRKIKSLVDTLGKRSRQGSISERTFLCPRCTSLLLRGNPTCKSCRLEFKNRAAGRKILFLVPGGGYFYTRHPLLGPFEAGFEIILLWGIVISLIRDGGQGVIGLGILLISVKLISIYHADHFLKEFLPIDMDIQVRPKQE